MTRISVLTIGGSDTSGGAGIQGDLKTIASFGLHGVSVITAITSQNTQQIFEIEVSRSVSKQLQCIVEDIPIAAIKIGMLYTKKNVKLISTFLEQYKDTPVILDPVICATTGRQLVRSTAIHAMTKYLFPKVTLLTPNLVEAGVILRKNITSLNDMECAAEQLAREFRTSILLKGGHLDGMDCTDILYDWDTKHSFKFINKRHEFENSHGTGCALATSIACQMAIGKTLKESVEEGKKRVFSALENGYNIGQGAGPIDMLLHRMEKGSAEYE